MTVGAVPCRYRVLARRIETADTVTLSLQPADEPMRAHQPGQFTMMYAPGVGEAPVSISGHGPGDVVMQTVRGVGAVTRALCAARRGTMIGVRGPYGTHWQLAGAAGTDLVIIAGGIGLAPLRCALLTALAGRKRFRRIVLLIGARSPDELVFAAEMAGWQDAGAEVAVTVDRAEVGWTGRVGVVTQLLGPAGLDPSKTTAFVCGPEVMLRVTGRDLAARGIPARQVWLSLERNMRCGVAECGHCQLGPLLLCRDGPVVRYDVAAPLLAIREL